MSATNKKPKTTTVSCYEPTRKYIADEAKRTNQPQREILAKMVDVYKENQARKAQENKEEKKEHRTVLQICAAIENKLDAYISHDQMLANYIKKHEQEIDSPVFKKVIECEIHLLTIEKILQKLH